MYTYRKILKQNENKQKNGYILRIFEEIALEEMDLELLSRRRTFSL